jgi:hypothetical protein
MPASLTSRRHDSAARGLDGLRRSSADVGLDLSAVPNLKA